MAHEVTVGECPVCGGPTRRAAERPYAPGEEAEVMELCWNGCYFHLKDYGEHHLRVGDRWWAHHDSSPDPAPPPEEINHAVEALKTRRHAHYKEPEARRFLAVLDRDRFDHRTRAVFSDWLEEHGYDDEAVSLRRWTREWQEARDHLLLCAAECRVTYDELLKAATEHLEAREGDGGATLFLGHDTPQIMYDTETFWRAYQAVTGRDTRGDRGGFFSCAC